MDILVIERFPTTILEEFRAHGFDVALVETEQKEIDFEQIAERAARENRMVLTFEKDVAEALISEESSTPPALVVFMYEPDVAEELVFQFEDVMGADSITLKGRMTLFEEERMLQKRI